MGEALFALSDALDLVGVDDTLHGKRVAFLALRLLEVLGESELRRDAYHAGLVHDCGVSSTVQQRGLMDEVTTSDGHSEVGARLLASFGPLAHLADVVRYHHTPWPQLREVEEVESRTALLSNVIFLADRVDVLQAKNAQDEATLRRMVQERLLRPSSQLFAPDLLDAARVVLEEPTLLPMLRSERRELFTFPGEDVSHVLTPADAHALALLFAHTVDAKSPFTARHSNGVAALTLHLADASGQLQSPREALEIAALLHDVGKLRVPDEILDKPGSLTVAEYGAIRNHAEDSRVILSRVGGFEDIARLAGMHHELLDGSGYPHGLRGDQIPFEAQCLTVADIFQALAQDRPYRRAVPSRDIMELLNSNVAGGRLNGELVRILDMDLELAWNLARAGEPTPASWTPQLAAG